MKKAILIAGIFIAFYGCKKEKPEESTEKKPIVNLKSEYLPMAVGNYWIYKFVEIDSNNVEKDLYYDSVVILKDSLIRDKKFYLFSTYRLDKTESTLTNSVFYTDSSRYLVTSQGLIHFSEGNLTDTLFRRVEPFNDGITTCKMEKVNKSVIVPSGTFNDVLDMKGTVTYNIEIYPKKPPRHFHYYYAKGVGKVMHTAFYMYSDNTNLEYRLLRYKIIQ